MTDKDKPHFAVVAPIFPVTDISTTINYFTEKLFFKIAFEWSDTEDDPVRYAVLSNGDTEIHLTKSDTPHKTAAYFFLDGVDEYYKAVKDTGANVTEDIQNQPWEMREFEVSDPDGNIILFGEHLDRIKENGKHEVD